MFLHTIIIKQFVKQNLNKMRKTRTLLLSVIISLVSIVNYAQSTMPTGEKDQRMVKLNNSQNSDVSLKVVVEADAELIGKVEGSSTGFKFVPIIPFLPRIFAGVIHTEASEINAEENALKGSGGDILLDKQVERTFTGIFLVIWIEKVTVSGYAAKLIKS